MQMVRAAVVLLVALVGCSGPCKETEAARHALHARKDVAAGPHARIQIPFELANRLLAKAIDKEPEIPLAFDKLGPLEPYVPKLHARLLTVGLGPAPVGLVHFDARIALADETGELMVFVAHADVTPTFDGHTLAIAIRADSLSRLEPELGPRARDRLDDAIIERLPASVRDHLPRIVIDRIAAKLAEEGAEQLYRLLRSAVLGHLGELTTIRIGAPDLPVSNIEVASTQGPVPSLALGVVSTLPVRTVVSSAEPAPVADEVAVAITGSAAAEATNWGIANKMLPPRYTRGLAPAPDGTYVPHFDWRADQPDRPLVVHMFKVEDGCAHFVVGVQPHVEVKDGVVQYWVENKNLEQVDAAFGFAMLARINSVFESSTSGAKKAPGHVHLTVGGRDVSGRVVRASIVDNELHAGIALDIHGPI